MFPASEASRTCDGNVGHCWTETPLRAADAFLCCGADVMGTPVWNSGWPMTEFSFAVRLSRGNLLWGRRLLAAERLVPIAGAGRGESRFGLAEIIIRLDLTETSRDRTPRCSDCNPQRQCQPFPGPSMHPSKGRGRASHSLLKDSGFVLIRCRANLSDLVRSGARRLGSTSKLNTSPRFGRSQRGGEQIEAWETNRFRGIPHLSSYLQ